MSTKYILCTVMGRIVICIGIGKGSGNECIPRRSNVEDPWRIGIGKSIGIGDTDPFLWTSLHIRYSNIIIYIYKNN